MKLSAILAPLVSAGVDAETILKTVVAYEQQQENELAKLSKADEERKAKGRERWRKWKESNGANVSKHEQTLANSSKRLTRVEDNNKTNNLEDISSLRSDNISIKPDFDREFEAEFWPAYPRKVGKGQALKAYRAARKQSDCQTITAGARRYAAERAGQDQQFTRHAATWLNGQGWLDEPASKPSPRSQAPPSNGHRPPSPAMQRHERIKQDIRREIYGDDDADTPSHSIDLAARDYFAH